MNGMDQAAYAAEQLAVQKDIEHALQHASALGLPAEELKLLAWASGVTVKEQHEH